jgi:hypothetical protein
VCSSSTVRSKLRAIATCSSRALGQVFGRSSRQRLFSSTLSFRRPPSGLLRSVAVALRLGSMKDDVFKLLNALSDGIQTTMMRVRRICRCKHSALDTGESLKMYLGASGSSQVRGMTRRSPAAHRGCDRRWWRLDRPSCSFQAVVEGGASRGTECSTEIMPKAVIDVREYMWCLGDGLFALQVKPALASLNTNLLLWEMDVSKTRLSRCKDSV